MRDREGLVQIVFDPDASEVFKEAERLRNEFVVRVMGTVRARPTGTVNANLASGRIEVLARQLEVLNVRALAIPASTSRSGRKCACATGTWTCAATS